MRYNLTIKKQRKLFWRDCEKAIATCAMPEDIDPEYYTWETGTDLSPWETLNFWVNDPFVNSDTNFAENLSNNACDTFDYYEEDEGIRELDAYQNGDDE